MSIASNIALQYDPAVWGTVGQWASAIGTTLAFLATFYVIRRDARIRKRQQAAKVAFFQVDRPREPEEVDGKWDRWYVGTVSNLSDEPIYDVYLMMVKRGRRRQWVDSLLSREILLPGEAAERSSEYSNSFREVDAVFRDNAGYHWQRTISGRLIPRSALAWTVFRRYYYLRSWVDLRRHIETSLQNRRIQRTRRKGEAAKLSTKKPSS